MRVRRLAALLLSTLLLAACGGSGSSGFDVSPGGFEAPLIERAIAEQRCIEGESRLLICPSGVTAPGPDGGMTPDPSGPRVGADFAGAIECGASGGCTISLGVATEALPPGSEVRVAVRASGADAWRVGEAIPVLPASDGEGTVTPVGVELPGVSVTDAEVQVAVLVFVPPLGVVPAEVQELHETGARYAFVLAPFALTPGVAP